MSQNDANNKLMSWFNISGEYSFSKRTSISSLYSLRRANFVENWQQSLLRVGISYKATSNLTLTPGYDWVISFLYGKQPIAEKFTEHRLFEQITLKQNIWKLKLNHRYRFEQRFFSNNSFVKHRFRYKLGLSIPIDKNTKWSLQAFDELFINYGARINNHIFDQNWIYAGILHKLNKRTALKLGYMNQYILKSNNNQTENNPILQFGINFKFKQ